MTTFERDVMAYKRELPGLLPHDEGKFVLIRTAEVISVLTTQDAAVALGYERFGHSEFLVKQICGADFVMMENALKSCQS